MDFSRPDRRSARTRAALLKAFQELLLEQGHEAMTVAQVADRANVGRSTLYEHFRTRDDLLRASLRLPFELLAGSAGPGCDQQGLAGLLRHFRSHAGVARVLLAQPLRSRIARVLAELLAARVAARPAARAIPTQLWASALAEGQLALIGEWLKGYPEVEAGEVAAALVALARPFSGDA